MRILVTGAAGFIAGYLIEELLDAGHDVLGIDNLSKYGPVEKSYSNHPRYRLVVGDVKDVARMKDLVADVDHLIAGAAMIGGIGYFHELAYDLLAENERIMAATFDAAIWARAQRRPLVKVTVLSSSMVFENADVFPTPEGTQLRCPPPLSTYGFQKLACEYYARGAFEQYQLPYTIVRPFNCVGVGETDALSVRDVKSGNISLALSHVVPDLVLKVLRGEDPLRILGTGAQVRHYTYGGDLARGIRVAMEHPAALNEDFNISTRQSTTVLELAHKIWDMIRPGEPLRYASAPALKYDVQRRVPDTTKCETLLGVRCETTLDEMLAEVIPWVAARAREPHTGAGLRPTHARA